MWWLIALTVGFAGFGVAALTGAPYVPILTAERRKVLEALQLKADQSLLDLGCGDGTMLIAAAQLGARAYGYEINPWLYTVARWRTRRYRELVTVRLGNYWHATWPTVDVIYVFLIGHYMPKLEQELGRRLQSKTTVVCYGFELPRAKPIKHEGAVWIYQMSPSEA